MAEMATKTKGMKTLTVKQPWASLIVHGIKDIENRTWPTKFRGRILIHSSANPVPFNGRADGVKFTNQQIREIWNSDFNQPGHRYPDWMSELPNGVLLGSVDIVDCVINHKSEWAEKAENCCPECMCIESKNHDLLGNGYRVCSNCEQEWWMHIKYDYYKKPIYNWVLANPVLFENPITDVKGKLSLWDFPNIHAELDEDEKPVCMCQLPVDEIYQVRVLGSGKLECKYCEGKWYK